MYEAEAKEGRGIPHPWKCKEDVPESIWNGFKWCYPRYDDEQYLRVLNDKYYWYWVRRDEERREEKAAKRLGGVPRASCFVCETKISEDQLERVGRLCAHHENELRRQGTMKVHGIELHYTGDHQ